MAIISQLSTIEPKTQKQSKQRTRTGIESQKWRSHGGLSVGRVWEEKGGKKVQGIRSISGRHKIGGG